jgi:hypothetical protein
MAADFAGNQIPPPGEPALGQLLRLPASDAAAGTGSR